MTFTSLYPNAGMPRHGIFVETRLRQLVASQRIVSRVIAPVRWSLFRQSDAGNVPRSAQRHGIEVAYPRFVAVPGVPAFSAFSMAQSALPVARALQREGFDFDLIDAHFFYPDGVAAALLGRWLGKPVVITARGSDIMFWPQFRLPKRLIVWAARVAARCIAVSEAVAHAMVALGISPKKIRVLRNGVDLAVFHPEPYEDTRRRLGFVAPTVLSVGNLVELKGHAQVIDAVARMPGVHLVIVGSGELDARLRTQVDRSSLGDRVRFVGDLPQEVLRSYYSAADALVLASSREGWPNVLLEAMACGTRVVATRVGGIPEIVTTAAAGILIDDRLPQTLAAALASLLRERKDVASTRAHAQRYDWTSTTNGQLALFDEVVRAADLKHEAAT